MENWEDALPTVEIELTEEEKEKGIPAFKLLVRAGMCKSHSEARRIIQQGGMRIRYAEEENDTVACKETI